MRRCAGVAGVALALLIVSAGCSVTEAKMNELSGAIADQKARIDALEERTAAVEAAQAGVAGQAKDMETRLKAGLAKIEASAKALEEVQERVDTFRERMSELTTANAGAQKTLIQSMETLMALHEQQYLAIKEALERLKEKSAALGAKEK